VRKDAEMMVGRGAIKVGARRAMVEVQAGGKMYGVQGREAEVVRR